MCGTNADRPTLCTPYPSPSPLARDIPQHCSEAVIMCSVLVIVNDQENLNVHLKRTLLNKGQYKQRENMAQC